MLQLNHHDPIVHSHGSHITANKVPYTSCVGIGHSPRECSPLYHVEVPTHTGKKIEVLANEPQGRLFLNNSISTVHLCTSYKWGENLQLATLRYLALK